MSYISRSDLRKEIVLTIRHQVLQGSSATIPRVQARPPNKPIPTAPNDRARILWTSKGQFEASLACVRSHTKLTAAPPVWLIVGYLALIIEKKRHLISPEQLISLC
ncbi:hypothetical protein BJX65DRAFT_207079 [Aspergillus insuetus]